MRFRTTVLGCSFGGGRPTTPGDPLVPAPLAIDRTGPEANPDAWAVLVIVEKLPRKAFGFPHGACRWPLRPLAHPCAAPPAAPRVAPTSTPTHLALLVALYMRLACQAPPRSGDSIT